MKSLRLALVGFAGLGLGMAPAQAQNCTTDAECAVPLTCRAGGTRCSQSGGKLPDGGMFVSDPICVADPSTCTWSLVACTADSECTLAHWACLALPAVGASSICFPEGIVCAAGQVCPAGWSCVDFSTVAEPTLADMWGPSSETKYCFPDVLRGIADKTTRTDVSGINPGDLGGGTESGGSGKGTGVSDGGIANTSRADAGAQPTTSDTGNQPTAKTGSSGCALGGRGPAALPWCLLAGVVAARLFRRRR